MTSENEQSLTKDVSKLRIEDENVADFRPRAHHIARDITEKFIKSSRALETGEIVKDENFTLFESVQALEIMDPKMDNGYLQPGETLEDQYNVCRELLPEEIIGIMDQMLCYEMAWHQGYPLAQNLFTSHYIDHLLSNERIHATDPYLVPDKNSGQLEPSSLIQLVLRSYCIGVIKSVDIVIEIVLSQHYYEEEDLNTTLFGRELLPDMPDAKCFALLEEANSWLRENCNLGQPVWSALLNRVIARQEFLTTVLPSKPDQEQITDWKQRRETMQRVKESHNLGKPIEEAFSAKIQRKLASTVPPRPIVTVEFDLACDELVRMYTDLEEAVKVQDLSGRNNLQNIMTFLWIFSSRKPEPSAFVRAVLQRLVFAENRVAGQNAMEHMLITELQQQLPLDKNIEESFWDVEVPTDGRYKVARMVDFFIEQATPEYQNIIRSLCQNTCRIRRCLTNVVNDFDNFQQALDAQLKEYSPPTEKTTALVSLTKRAMIRTCTQHKLQCMAWILQQGFEQDLYSPHELPLTYWYLSRLASARCALIRETLSTLTSSRPPALTATTAAPAAALALATTTASFAAALSALYSALPVPPPPATRLTTPAAQFTLRFRAFAGLATAPSWAQWDAERARREAVPPSALLAEAKAGLAAAREALAGLLKRKDVAEVEQEVGCVGAGPEWRAESGRVLRAVIKAAVAVEGLIKAGGRASSVQVPPVGPGRDHAWWVVPTWKVEEGG